MAGACVNNETLNQTGTQGAGSLFGDADEFSQSENITDSGMLLEDAVSKYRISTNTEAKKDDELIYYINTGGIPAELCQIIGSGVDREGIADTWMFGIRYGKNTSLVYPYNSWWREASWPGALPEDEIDTDSIIMPSDILSRNAQSVGSLFDSSETGKIYLILKDGIYFLTPEKSDSITEIKINAYTGEVISQL